MSYTEPVHETSSRSTASSQAEGRLKVCVSGKKKLKKKKLLLKVINKKKVYGP